MTEANSPHLLEHIVVLTSLREQHALQLCLVKTLQEFISANEIALYGLSTLSGNATLKLLVSVESPGDSGDPSQAKRFPALRTIEDDPDLKQCITTKKQVISAWQDGRGGKRKSGIKVIYPVTTEQGVVGFFIIKCAKLIEKDQEMAISFLRIYHNYLQLINANEHDALTGLLNRKSFAEKMMTVLAAQRSNQDRISDTGNQAKHCLAMLDIDHFKKVNDKFGHLHGDEVLLLFARLMTQTFRGDDQLYRYGGEEFVVFLKNADLTTGLSILERFRAKLEVLNIPQVGKVTVSIGAVEVNKQDLPTTVVEQADKALYYAKDNGRNQVCAYEKLLEAGKLNNILTSGDIELF